MRRRSHDPQPRVGLIVYRASTQGECESWLRENPHPPWNPPTNRGNAVAACSGPFRIVHKVRDWLPAGEQWQVIAEHHERD